jgi:hypothetical protein
MENIDGFYDDEKNLNRQKANSLFRANFALFQYREEILKAGVIVTSFYILGLRIYSYTYISIRQ